MAKQVIGIGTVPNDGTGDDIRDAFDKTNDNFNECYPTQVTSLTLLDTGWSLDSSSGLYEYDLSNANITANSIVEVIPDNADIDIVRAADILPRTDSSAGVVTIYATNEPTDDIGVTINIVEKDT